MTAWKRSEVEEAWHHFVEVGDSGDWSSWADLHTEDGLWVEHHLGLFEGREAIIEARAHVAVCAALQRKAAGTLDEQPHDTPQSCPLSPRPHV